MDEPIIRLNCYEPAGTSVDFSREDLLGHTLAIGGSGSGKTTRLVYPLVDQLVRKSEDKVSLCIFDTKADGAMQRLLARACHEAGRAADLCVIELSSSAYLNCFNDLGKRPVEYLDALAGLIAAALPVDERNRYWDTTFQALLRQALRLHAFNSQAQEGYGGLIRHLMRYLLVHQLKDLEYTRLVAALEKDLERHPAAIQAVIEEISAVHTMWETLDFRTRTNLQSMAASVIGPMNSPISHGLFQGNDPVDIAAAMDIGRIVLVSIDAVRHPEAARFIGVLLKGLFYDAVLGSRSGSLKGLILDDWPLCVTSGFGNRYSDVEALSMIRSFGGFLVAATQSLAALDLGIGSTARAAAVANFGNLVFFRSRDQLVDELAAIYLGQKSDKLIDYTRSERPAKTGRVEQPIRIEREVRVPTVPPGALAKLPTGDAFAIIGGQAYAQAMCLVPTFSTTQTKDKDHER